MLHLDRALIGVTTMCEITTKLSQDKINAQDLVSKAMTDKFRTVDFSSILKVFDKSI